MPNVSVYKNGQQIEIRNFAGHFFISGHQILFWRTYEDEAWTTDQGHNEKLEFLPRAQRQINLLKVFKGYELSEILPTWQLSLNGRKCERGFYGNLTVFWREIKLSYRNYEFIFLFEEEEIEHEDKSEAESLPKPLLDRTEIDLENWEQLK